MSDRDQPTRRPPPTELAEIERAEAQIRRDSFGAHVRALHARILGSHPWQAIETLKLGKVS